MTSKDEGHYAKKHPKSQKVDQKISRAVKERASEGKISCAEAFGIAKDLGVSSHETGVAIDFLEIKITHCQLGIFGYGKGGKHIKPMAAVAEELKNAIEDSVKDGRLACRDAWKIAESLGTGKMEVASACETLDIKLSACQLGAF